MGGARYGLYDQATAQRQQEAARRRVGLDLSRAVADAETGERTAQQTLALARSSAEIAAVQ